LFLKVLLNFQNRANLSRWNSVSPLWNSVKVLLILRWRGFVIRAFANCRIVFRVYMPSVGTDYKSAPAGALYSAWL